MERLKKHLDEGRRPGGELRGRRGVHRAQVAQDGQLDVLQLLPRVGVAHVADADAQAVRVHVVVVVTQRLGGQAAGGTRLVSMRVLDTWHGPAARATHTQPAPLAGEYNIASMGCSPEQLIILIAAPAHAGEPETLQALQFFC